MTFVNSSAFQAIIGTRIGGQQDAPRHRRSLPALDGRVLSVPRSGTKPEDRIGRGAWLLPGRHRAASRHARRAWVLRSTSARGARPGVASIAVLSCEIQSREGAPLTKTSDAKGNSPSDRPNLRANVRQRSHSFRRPLSSVPRRIPEHSRKLSLLSSALDRWRIGPKP